MRVVQTRCLFVTFMVGGWTIAIAACLLGMISYERTPGAIGAARPAEGPAAETLKLRVYMHPRCPCSRASVAELARVLHGAAGVDCEVHFFRPAFEPDAWAYSDTWLSVAALPGVRVLSDPDGAASRRAGALTSGHAVLVGSDGRVVFSGGLTEARGLQGANKSSRALAVCLAQGQSKDKVAAPVFGCRITDEPTFDTRGEAGP